MPTPTYTPLANLTLSTNASSVTFSSISQAYRDLVLVVCPISTTATADLQINFNGDSTNGRYAYCYMYGGQYSGNYGASGSDSTIYISPGSPTYTNAGNTIITINMMDYSATDKQKSILIKTNVASIQAAANIGKWNQTTAISSFVIKNVGATNFAAGSSFALYGIAA